MNKIKGLLCLTIAFFSIDAANAQSENLELFLDKVHLRMSSHPDSLCYTAEARQTTFFMSEKWQPEKTIIIDKIIHQNGSRRNEDIQKAIKRENGEDVDITEKLIEETKKNAEKKGNSISINSEDLFPFDPEVRTNYRFELRPDSLWNGKPVNVIYAHGLKESSDFYRGNYYIDSENYDVLGVDVRPIKNPKFVKTFNMRMSFTVVPEGYYVLEKYRMQMYASLLIKKVRMVFEEVHLNYQFENTGG